MSVFAKPEWNSIVLALNQPNLVITVQKDTKLFSEDHQIILKVYNVDVFKISD